MNMKLQFYYFAKLHRIYAWRRIHFLAILLFPWMSAEARVIEDSLDRIEGLSSEAPEIGEGGLRFLTPQVLEVVHINSKEPNLEPASWTFANEGVFSAPDSNTFTLAIDGEPVTATIMGFRRRVLLARSGIRDIRIDNRLFLKLLSPATAGAKARLEAKGWQNHATPTGLDELAVYQATLDAGRRSPAIHTNHGGYISGLPKQAMVGCYLGTSGEMDIPSTSFQIVRQEDGSVVYEGTLVPSVDIGFGDIPAPYNKVMKADFTAWNTPGNYKLQIPGLGHSLPFKISKESALYFARCYATGLLNQRCGQTFGRPYTRHGHAACHTAHSEIPTNAPEFSATWQMIAACNEGSSGIAPRLVSAETQLYPILKKGPIDTSGGHHDAGDYSKYTINSAQLIHSLVFAVDAFPNVAQIDNLGIPESGDGKSDLLQKALHEATFLAKLQDDDGGFFFLVYPKNRKYENNVLPEHGDPQVVWPKNTASTAAAVGALADIASSPVFKRQYPQEAEQFLHQAKAGWEFLLRAIELHGKDGSYQKITHYGDLFLHDDELAWAAASMFAATGDPVCHSKLLEWYDPAAGSTIRWGWWRLFEGYGCAARSYAFAVRTGKRNANEINATQLAKSEAIILARANDVKSWTNQSAYGVSFDTATKRFSSAGWFFPVERAFDIVVAEQISNDPENIRAVLSNINYEFGTNPLNLTYLTGCGLRSQEEIVHQFAENDDRRLPPSGIPIGSVQAGFVWNNQYQRELSQMTIPPDWISSGRYPFYDRWADTFNVTTEFVIAQQGKGLAAVASIAAMIPEAVSQPWNTTAHSDSTIQLTDLNDGYATVGQPFTATLTSADVPDLSEAIILWETIENYPIRSTGASITIIPTKSARQWIEAEALLPDGKRICARTEFGVKAQLPEAPVTLVDTTVALYDFDSGWSDSSPNAFHLIPHGNPEIVPLSAGWASNLSTNQAVRFCGNDDGFTVGIPDRFVSPFNTPTPLILEFRICPLRYTNRGRTNTPLLSLTQSWANRFGIHQNMWANPTAPDVCGDNIAMLTPTDWQKLVPLGAWNKVHLMRDATGKYELTINGTLVSTGTKTADFGGVGEWQLIIGHFDGYIDDIRISGLPNHGNTTTSGNTTAPLPDQGTNDENNTLDARPTILEAPFSAAYLTDEHTTALYHFDGNLNDSSDNGLHLTYSGNPVFVETTDSCGQPNGHAIRFSEFGDSLTVTIPDSLVSPGNTPTPITLEAWIMPRSYKAWGKGTAGILYLHQSWDSLLGINQDKWLKPAEPAIRSGNIVLTEQSEWSSFIQPGIWNHLQIVRGTNGHTTLLVNGESIKSTFSNHAWARTNDWTFTIGNLDADIDEIRVSQYERPPISPKENPDANEYCSDEFEPDTKTLALYHFNGNTLDEGPNGLNLIISGNATFDTSEYATAWLKKPTGGAVRFANVGDQLSIEIPNDIVSPGSDTTPITIEAMIHPEEWKAYGVAPVSILRLFQSWDSHVGLIQDKWNLPALPSIKTGNYFALNHLSWGDHLKYGTWNHLKICRTSRKTTIVTINGVQFPEVSTPTHDGRPTPWALTIGNFKGMVDELRISLDER